MVRRLIEWAVRNPLIVLLLVLALSAVGSYAFLNVNVEAYPDPAPAIIEVIAQWPGRSAEEIERRVTVPLEVALAGMPGLKYTRTKSLAGLCHMRNQFDYGIDYYAARQEVINRLQFVTGLPTGVTPTLSPESPTGEIFRYTLSNPRDETGRELPIYNLNDLKALQDWVLEREFKRVPRIDDVASSGGTIKRYEVHPDPDRLRRFGITLQQVQNALANGNDNVGGDIMPAGHTVLNVRGVGLISGGQDPQEQVLGLETKELEALFRAQAGLSKAFTERVRAAYKGAKLEPPFNEDEQRQYKQIRQRVGLKAAVKAAGYLRAEEEKRIRQIRQIVIASVNNVPVRIEDIAEGGPLRTSHKPIGAEGVIIGHQTRLGKVTMTRPMRDYMGREVLDKGGQPRWVDEDEKVQAIVLLRKNEDSLPALRDVEAKVKQLNEQAGRMLPGVQIEPYYDRTDLIDVTTETVRENLVLGMVLVSVILLMFLTNVRSALIVAVNIPLALVFAFAALFLRGKSANLLSIGAVDFGIIVDSSVIMVENIYRHLSSGEYAELPLRERIIRASHEVERSLFYSTAIMVCAFIPLFTMQGPEGQIFGPMAQTYAFALGGALLLALTLAPVLCFLFFKGLKPARDNLLVRWLKRSYLRQLERCLRHRWVTLGIFAALIAFTVGLLPFLGREFMPELEEGNLWIRGTFPLSINLERVSEDVKTAREIMRHYPEVETVVNQTGRPDDGTDSDGFYNAEFFVPLKPQKEWPTPATHVTKGAGVRGEIVARNPGDSSLTVKLDDGQQREFRLPRGTPVIGMNGKETPDGLNHEQFQPGAKVVLLYHSDHRTVREVRREHDRPRTKPELIEEMNADLTRNLSGVNWNFSQNIRDNVMEALSGVKGDNSVKIFGPNLNELDKLADQVKARLATVRGIQNVGVFRIKGQSNLDLWSDPDKCAFWGASRNDVNAVIASAVGGQPFSSVVEGEKTFDLTLRWPWKLREDESAILNIPVDITNNTVAGGQPSLPPSALIGPAFGLNPLGFNVTMAALYGSQYQGTVNNISATPRRRLGDLLTPLDAHGEPDPNGSYTRPGASTIYREQGHRLIAVKFSVQGRDLAGAVADAQKKTADLFKAPYRAEWSGEFQEMQDAERRLMWIIPLSLGLIFILLYLAFHSLLDAFLVLTNVVALSLGGVWALLLTGTNFSISAAVGFISIFGVAIMDGLLLVSYFNQLRFEGLSVRDAVMQGAEKRVRPVMMTALTAIFGLLPAALSTRIGAQTQRPLAIVVVGGMITTLFLTRYLMPVLYSFYGHREPPAESSRMGH
ncbi:MAG TPA: efflux RND transporter permease subunit [Gemmataceae bacterium]|jgi:Cu/Ag efflux pump CusA|nr:efflux RND transporter permease subunit [Gemmataceae bacterium]